MTEERPKNIKNEQRETKYFSLEKCLFLLSGFGVFYYFRSDPNELRTIVWEKIEDSLQNFKAGISPDEFKKKLPKIHEAFKIDELSQERFKVLFDLVKEKGKTKPKELQPFLVDIIESGLIGILCLLNFLEIVDSPELFKYADEQFKTIELDERRVPKSLITYSRERLKELEDRFNILKIKFSKN